ncbi:MAG: HAMP domain-containing histidine kinase [Rhodospirillales bacterium]|nr:HAMP domain-containing histidine kinase [Rhodospirillales bacterium]
MHRTGFRWSLALVTPLAAGTLLMLGVAYWLGTYALHRTIDQAVLEQLDLLSARPASLLPFMIRSRMVQRPAMVTDVGLFTAEGRPMVGDITVLPRGLPLDGKVRTVEAAERPGTGLLRERAAGRILANGRILVVARDTSDIAALRDSLLRGLAIAALPAFLVSLALAILIERRTRRRLEEMRRASERIIAGALDHRLPRRAGGGELDELAGTVNRILDRLERVVRALQEVGENIAHDLRTPLTAVRARLERAGNHAETSGAVRAITAQAIGGVDQALSIVSALLRIAEMEQGRQIAAFEPCDLVALIGELVGSYLPVAEEHGIALHTELTIPATVAGDRDLLIEALANLLENCLKFTPAGGHVTIAIIGTTRQPIVRIRDTGPGIPPARRPLVFGRFYRGEEKRGSGGIGLGLSLVAAVIRLHGFAIRIFDASPGCIVELRCWQHGLAEAWPPPEEAPDLAPSIAAPEALSALPPGGADPPPTMHPAPPPGR